MTRASENIHGLEAGSPARLAETEIVKRIYAAVLEQRLPPGTKLSEAALCDAFQVSRMRIRRVLLLLASREIVELLSNRGAYIARPTPEAARNVFEARRTIEPTVISNAVHRITDDELDLLVKHKEAETKARESNNRRDAIRLSGEFHVKLAAIGANPVLERFVKELVARTSLIIGMFGAPGIPNCSDEEHQQLLDTIRARDAEQAAAMMLRHLRHIERDLDLSDAERQNVDVRRIFSS